MCIWPQLFLTFKQSVQEAKVSEKRKHYLLPTKLGLLDLEATFSTVDFELWNTYFLGFVIMGNSGPRQGDHREHHLSGA